MKTVKSNSSFLKTTEDMNNIKRVKSYLFLPELFRNL